jgi:hypothetical protein
VLVKSLAGDEGAQVIDVSFSLDVGPPGQKRVEGYHQHGGQQQAVYRAQLKGEAQSYHRAVPGGEDDGPAPVVEEAAPG